MQVQLGGPLINLLFVLSYLVEYVFISWATWKFVNIDVTFFK